MDGKVCWSFLCSAAWAVEARATMATARRIIEVFIVVVGRRSSVVWMVVIVVLVVVVEVV